ncbi:hypothetical protein SAMN05443549_1011093 [Flavobacterium fluvii]|uniref:CarboxypepD_reg-like domain-containing protein n=1 Tax=Flavobacterium fluvii TaxID=468056 RepID=A0A1M5G5J2_9FLAO|nr:hypothetical protein [Flavobacterium fluvii]SHF98721.1 hypothetical protein SAMN05443549_1011093 [Flavobacterium fluvii]
MKSKIILFVLGLFSQISFGQTAGEKLIHGKIIVESGNAAGVSIVNLVNEKSATSDGNGDFYILAKADDLLVFSSVNLEYYRRLIEKEDLKPDVLIIKMIAKTTELDEVIVNKRSKINAVALGISPKGIVQRTRAEKRLYAANSMPVAALINLMSGRTEMLKKEIEVEKKELLLAKIGNLYSDEYFVNTLKVPSEYIKGFQYYIVESERFTTIFKSKNKINIELVMVELAVEYNAIIAAGNK